MNPETHLKDEAFDRFCREIVTATQASEDEIHAAANAPFLYQRLRAQIAAEQTPITAQTPQRSTKMNFVAAVGAFARLWHWERWAVATTAIALAIWVGWKWQPPVAPPTIAQQSALVVVTQTPAAVTNIATPAPVTTPDTLPRTNKIAQPIKAVKSLPAKAMHVQATNDEVEEAEIATDFMPLTYTTHPDDQQGQIVRMEVPRSMLATLGVPLANVTGDRVKADVMMSEDGVALAIRFIQPQ